MVAKRHSKVDDSLTAFKPRAGTNPRSRAGCLTCKAKHTKCDETRPECLRCTRKGIKCGGYWREFKWSFKHQPGSKDAAVEGPDANPDENPAEGVFLITEQGAPASLPRRPRDSESFSPDNTLASVSSATDNENSEAIIIPVSGGSGESVSPRQKTARRTSVPRPASRRASSSRFCRDAEHDVSTSSLITSDRFPGGPTFVPASITDTSSLLISNWFEQVCPAWSGFDSAANLNRRLATELWHESRSVFSSLQSMSAAFLSTRLPHMRLPAVRFMQTATESIQAEVKAIRGRVHLDTIPTGLLFSLFCLGTTVCWIDAAQLGLPFFREARLLLDRLNRRLPALYEKDAELLTFFNKSLTYCEMLLAVVSDGEPSTRIDNMQTQASMGKAGPEQQVKMIDVCSPHPWTGISTPTSRLFAQSMRLCRSFRHNIRQQRHSGRDFQTALLEIQEAQSLEEQLLGLEFPSILNTNDTGDHLTPYLHLAKIAEAYQLASLLQLYQTFPDLVSLRLPINSAISSGGQISWEEWIIPLSLRLVRVLEHIPPSSGSRAIQPLLYISASTGLRYDTKASMDTLDLGWNLDMESMEVPFQPSYDDGSSPLDIEPIDASQMTAMGPALISRMSLDISNARHFITGRLSMLENSLPPKPIIMAKTLIQAVWDAYDSEMPGSTTVHWVDVMEDNNLRTMFG
ncbi:fungal-specific transcription factor domain-containing protein [Ilyonectria robusta]|uniref:fungal-specific transcription factor domain-containing protein n=1 Tax=Ilyonectria robusta TaxID=1079257 RepID=UPI001E8D29B2|nr:fungal-specific transcription factor domain-containing protein [Ilyonectria robusta]KAH8686476.1 fungal-specific transcription factor domain-containing protein [Ilyonectria robusta]